MTGRWMRSSRRGKSQTVSVQGDPEPGPVRSVSSLRCIRRPQAHRSATCGLYPEMPYGSQTEQLQWLRKHNHRSRAGVEAEVEVKVELSHCCCGTAEMPPSTKMPPVGRAPPVAGRCAIEPPGLSALVRQGNSNRTNRHRSPGLGQVRPGGKAGITASATMPLDGFTRRSLKCSLD